MNLDLSTSDLLLLMVTGLGAGMLNAAVGSGTLITYPALLSVGLPPVIANGTNSLAMAFGNASATWVYRPYFSGRREQLIRWCVATAAGAVLGASLVVALPSKVFEALVPFLILSAVVVIAIQPWLTKKIAARENPPPVGPAVAAVGVYGGYFGAGQGIAYLAALGSLDARDIQSTNAVKNLLATCANGAGAITFLLAGRVMIIPALIVGVAALVGGFAGGGIAKRLPMWVLRGFIILVGLYAVAISLSKVF